MSNVSELSDSAIYVGSLEDFVRSKNSSLLTKRTGDKDQLSIRIFNQTETVCLITAYSVIILLSLIGNLTVCRVVCRSKNFQNSTYILLTNIATSDLVITLMNIPFTLVRILYDDWIFGSLMCKLVNYTLMLSIYVSTSTMTAIAIGKYVTVIYPLRAKWTNLSVILLCVLIWIGSLLISLPFLIFSQQKEISLSLHISTRCVVIYPKPSILTEKVMTVVTFLLQFLLPVITTSLAYGGIICRIYDQFYRPLKTHNRSLQNSCTHLSSQFKLVKMLFIVVMVFTFCWLPLNIYHLLMDFYTGDNFTPHSASYLACHWFAMSSVCYNPIIYCWMHGAFRRQITVCNRCLGVKPSRHSTRSPPKIQETPVAM